MRDLSDQQQWHVLYGVANRVGSQSEGITAGVIKATGHFVAGSIVDAVDNGQVGQAVVCDGCWRNVRNNSNTIT